MSLSSQFVHLGTRVYSGLKRVGLFRDPVTRWAFEQLYEQYKLRIEARDVVRTLRLITEGSIAFDIGANVGMLTIPMARRVGGSGKVIAIEPAPENLRSLRQRLETRQMSSRVQVFEGVASNRVGTEKLVLTPLQPWDHHIGQDGEDVAATTVDALVAAMPPAPVSYVKIDVQGAEQLVLEGMRETLRTHRPALCIEIDPPSLRRFNTGFDNLVELLGRSQYVLHDIKTNGFHAATKSGAPDALARAEYFDALFLHESAAGREPQE